MLYKQNPATDPNPERLEFWAQRVCLESIDLFHPEEEKEFREEFINSELLKLDITVPIPHDFRPARDLHRAIEEAFASEHREECACSHLWAELLVDYALATPDERMTINLVLLRLVNISVYHLISMINDESSEPL